MVGERFGKVTSGLLDAVTVSTVILAELQETEHARKDLIQKLILVQQLHHIELDQREQQLDQSQDQPVIQMPLQRTFVAPSIAVLLIQDPVLLLIKIILLDPILVSLNEILDVEHELLKDFLVQAEMGYGELGRVVDLLLGELGLKDLSFGGHGALLELVLVYVEVDGQLGEGRPDV